MAITRNSIAGMGYVGIPALIFIELNNYGRGTQSYEEKRVIQHKLFSYLQAYLHESYSDKKAEEYNQKLDPLFGEVAGLISQARDEYKPTFEGIGTCDPDEKKFQETMDAIFEKLTDIISISHVIDKQKPGDEEMVF
jgi:hypothetical protein